MHKDRVFDNGITVTSERPEDYKRISEIITKAFKEDREDHLVDQTRQTELFNPEYSLVARKDGKAVGHLMLNTVLITSPVKETKAVIIAPLTVDPEFQGGGAGKALVTTAIERAKADGMPFMLVMGGKYYEKFGFMRFSDEFGIFRPNPVLGKQRVRIMELKEGGLNGVSGVIKYPESFKHMVHIWYK